MIAFAPNDRAFETEGESRMAPPLVDWMKRRRWLREDSIVVRELAVNGRRVDLVTMTRSGVLSAFELKLSGFSRALEQAFYNKRIFDRSWIVVGNMPRPINLEEARRFGVGVIVVVDQRPKVILRPGPSSFDIQMRSRVRHRLLQIGFTNV